MDFSKFLSCQPNEVRNKPILKIILAFVVRYETDHTRTNYKRYLRNYCIEMGIGSLENINEIRFSEIRLKSANYIGNFQAETTRNFVKSIVKSFWDYLVKEYDYPCNPILGLKIEPPCGGSDSVISYEELEKKLEKLYKGRKENQMSFLACVLSHTLIETTLNISEVLQIKVCMVKEGKITIHQKRLKRVREISLSKKLQKLMVDFIKEYEVTEDLFTTSRGYTINRNNACRLLKSYTGVGPHNFRKSVLHAAKSEKGCKVSSRPINTCN